jgi:type II secretory ATPase GspE/PulE/Tfp pilus assembly ATPase PilB-like protein
VYEIMEATGAIRRLVHGGAGTHQLREKLREQKVMTLREDGVLRALEGRTSLDEILRVTHSDEETGMERKGSGEGRKVEAA